MAVDTQTGIYILLFAVAVVATIIDKMHSIDTRAKKKNKTKIVIVDEKQVLDMIKHDYKIITKPKYQTLTFIKTAVEMNIRAIKYINIDTVEKSNTILEVLKNNYTCKIITYYAHDDDIRCTIEAGSDIIPVTEEFCRFYLNTALVGFNPTNECYIRHSFDSGLLCYYDKIAFSD
jgi:hypothetical protein